MKRKGWTIKLKKRTKKAIIAGINKVLASLLLVTMNWQGLCAVAVTGAYFADGESSNSNLFNAGILDMAKSETPWTSTSLTPGMTITRTVTISKPAASIGFKYGVVAQNVTGDLCSSLNIAASKNNQQVYNGLVSDFQIAAQPYSGTDEVWSFAATLTSNDPSLNGKSCNFNFAYNATQATGSGFSDSAVVVNTIGSGTSWGGTWVQTSVNDFGAYTPVNTVVFDNDSDGDSTDDAGSVKLAVQAAGGEQSDQSQGSSNNSYTVMNRSSQNWGAQIFTANKSGTLKKITLRLKKNNSNTTPSLVVEIKNVIGGKPAANIPLGSITKTADDFNTSEADYIFDFTSQAISIISGTQYAIVLHENGNANNNNRYYSAYYQDQDNTDPYSGGGKFVSINGGSNWSESSSQTCETVCDGWIIWPFWCGSSHQDCTSHYQDFQFSTTVQTADTYYESGTLTSIAYGSNMMARWDNLAWNEALNGGSITFRVAAMNDPDQEPVWQTLTESPNNTISLASLPESSYLKWEATLNSSTDHAASPVLDDVTVSYMAGMAGTSVKLNEFLPRPSSGSEWVELYNKGGRAVDLSNWQVKDKDGVSTMTIPANTILSPADWDGGNLTGDALDNVSDGIELYDPLGHKVDFYNYNLCDSASLTKTPDATNGVILPTAGTCESGIPVDKSFARIPDGTGPWYDPVPTPGGINELSEEELEALSATTTEEIVTEEIIPSETTRQQLAESLARLDDADSTTTDAVVKSVSDGNTADSAAGVETEPAAASNDNVAADTSAGDASGEVNAADTAGNSETEPAVESVADAITESAEPSAEEVVEDAAAQTGGTDTAGETVGQLSFEENSDAVLEEVVSDNGVDAEESPAADTASQDEQTAIASVETSAPADVPSADPTVSGGSGDGSSGE